MMRPRPSLLPNLSRRVLHGELMDDPELEHARHHHALRGLQRLNQTTNATGPTWSAIQRAADNQSPPLTILDVGCGGGDTLCSLGARARKAGLAVELTGIDISSTALELAKQNVQRCGLTAEFRVHNILDTTEIEQFDVVHCSLFLHHFTNEQAVTVLRSMAVATRKLLLVSDLRRTAAGYALAVVGTRLLTRSHIVHVDGPRSVEAAFRIEEARTLCEHAGLSDAQIIRTWPQRFLLQWSPE